MTSETNGPKLERKFSIVGESLYTILEVPKTSDQAAIKRAYRKLALKYHPDKNPGSESAAEKFKEINRAHNILSNEEKRRIYDLHGSMGLNLLENTSIDPKLLSQLSSPWFKCCLVFCCLVSCCCCCLCCCCCCGKIKPDSKDDSPHEDGGGGAGDDFDESAGPGFNHSDEAPFVANPVIHQPESLNHGLVSGK